MRSLLLSGSVALAVVASARGAASADADAAPACAGTFDLHVVDATTHDPLEAVTITVEGATGPDASTIEVTGADGHVVLRGLCPTATADLVLDGYQPYQLALRDARSGEVELIAASGEVIEVIGKRPPPAETRSATTIGREALEASGGRGFADVLDQVPGVAMLRAASGMAKPVVRGQYGRRLALLVDGIRHRAQEWGLDHAPEVDPFVAASVTVVRGAAGVRYGPDAIGGAVLVDSPALPDEPGVDAELHLSGGTNPRGGSVAARVLAGSSRWPALRGLVEGSVRRAAAGETPGYPLDNTGAFEASQGAAVGYQAAHGLGDVQLTWRRYQARLGVCSCLRIDSRDDFLAQLMSPTPVGVDAFRPDFDIGRPYQAVEHDLVLARAHRRLADRGTLTATYAFQYDLRREYDVVREATTGPQFRFRLYTHDAEVAFEHDPVHLSDHAHLEGGVGVVGMAQVHQYAGLPLIPDHVGGGAGVHATERLVGHAGQLELGLRYDVLHRTATLERIDFLRLVRSGQLAQEACGALGDTVDCASTFHTLSASLGGLRHITDRLTLKADLSTAARPPSTDEQYINGTAPTFPVLALGKPDLGPETTYAASLTASYQGDRLAAEASVYGNWIDDYIDLAPALDASGAPIFDVLVRGTFPRFVSRAVDATFVGVDGGVTATPVPWLELAASGSVVRARDRSNDRYLTLVPADRAVASVTLRRDTLWGLGKSHLGVTATLVRRQTRVDANTDLAPPPPGYALLGLEAGSEVTSNGRPVRFSVDVQNLTNARYRDYTSLLRYFADQPGRQIVVHLTVPLSAADGA